MALRIKYKNEKGREAGITLAETIVALGILATIAVVFLTGMISSTKAAVISDEKTTAESIAQSQMEYVQNATYAAEYVPTTLIQGGDYSVTISVVSLNNPDNGIQQITVDVFKDGRQVYDLTGYKSNR